ncbi:BQ5605_C002g01391 [Microbotryum silenes-dioicae]|uniref:BQ5605_C002g01391 protein n=1 Tax=Microbotryum silenes-dioicae TaxID=796604 RepID=A0A2X0M2I2_9BASI|nr:BQ5605_C002g01391 [Microbotryum silenes-dioicae]
MSMFGAVKPPDQPDVVVQNTQTDGISALAWSPAADLLAVGSWSNQVRIFEVGPNGQNQGRSQYTHEGPVLDVAWSKDGTKIVSGGADNAGRVYDLATGQTTQFAAHDAPIRSVKWLDIPGSPMVVTGSWDKTLRYWDMRQPTPAAQVQLPERCYTLDVTYPLMVVGTAERHCLIFNLNQPTTPFKTMTSPLKMQTRSLATFPDGDGYAITSVEGRVAIQYVDDAKSSNNFSFKCHRADISKTPGFKTGSQSVYAINEISFHPLGTFSTAGSDGVINMWDHTSRTRLKTWTLNEGSVTATDFSRTGQYLAYAISYDWSKGHNGNGELSNSGTSISQNFVHDLGRKVLPNHPNKVCIHTCTEEEVKKRPKK